MFERKHRKVYNFLSTNLKEPDNGKRITQKLKFIDSFMFMSSSL